LRNAVTPFSITSVPREQSAPNFTMQLNRRNFLKTASAAAVTAAVGAAAPTEKLKVGLNAYSFNKLLNDAIRKRGPGITLDGVLDFAAKNKFAAFDPTGYFMPGYPKRPDDSYVDSLKKHAADLGIALSGTGVRNNFTTADKDVRAEGVAHIKELERTSSTGSRAIFESARITASNIR
jgi:hypothetical protein